MTTPPDAEAVVRDIPQEVDYANGIITAAIAFNAGTLPQEGIRPFIDAYREAVERRVRAELLAKVERIPRHDWAEGTLVDRNEVLAAFRAAQDHLKGGPDDGQ